LPAESVATTWNSWPLTARPVYCRGEVHGPNAAPSSEHANVLASFAENARIALVLCVVAGGPELIMVCGGVSSTMVHE
jgi:hypothetical protein